MTTPTLEPRFQEPQDWQWGTITNARGMKLRYGGLPVSGQKAKAHIVFVEGLNGCGELTFELARDFNRQAQSFWVLDRAGQGLSSRHLSALFNMHAGDFRDDTADLIQMVKETVPQDGAPVFLLGHSTGGLIALDAAHEAPELFAGVILSAPLTGIHDRRIRGRESWLARLPVDSLRIATRGMPGFEHQSRAEAGTTDKFSSDPARNKLKDYWMATKPKLKTGDLTLGWIWQACRAISRVTKPEYLAEITVPVLAFAAGDDFLVSNKALVKALKHLPETEPLQTFPKGKHELFLEEDKIRTPYMATIGNFIRKHAPSSP